MPSGPLNRREFLRLSLVLTSSALATACQTTQPRLTSTEPPEPSLESGIKLNTTSADAWTFSKPVIGSMANPAACKVVWLENDDQRVQAALNESFFSASVPIRAGANS